MGDDRSFIGRVERRDERLVIAGMFDDTVLRQPAYMPPRGSIVRVEGEQIDVVAEPGTARARIWGILERYQLDPFAPAAVGAEVEELLENPGLDDPELEDYRDLPFVTIDNEGSRDLDQALLIEQNERNGYLVRYALADASFYARFDGALFADALHRGATYYVPGLAVPMLPTELSEGLVSLNPNVDRRAVVFETELTADGEIIGTRVVRAVIHSQAKLTYDEVQTHYDAGWRGPLAGRPYSLSLQRMRDVGEIRVARARERGVVEFNRVEASIGFADAAGMRLAVGLRVRNDVERWNEQLSLLCNIEGARLLLDSPDDPDLQAIFRVHPAPLDKRRQQLRAVIDGMVDARGLPDDWRWEPSDDRTEEDNLATYLSSLPEGERATRARAAIERQIRYIHRASEFRPIAGRHYALAVEGYARFSSPMREIVGIFTHKEALEKLGFVAPASPAADEALRDRVIARANDAKSLQKRLDKEVGLLAINQLLSDDLDLAEDERPARVGTILGLTSSRIYVELDEVPIDLKLYRDDIEHLYGCTFDRSEVAWVAQSGDGPTFRLGDGVTLRVIGYDERRRRWLLRPAVLPW